jgi:hypothetical protein
MGSVTDGRAYPTVRSGRKAVSVSQSSLGPRPVFAIEFRTGRRFWVKSERSLTDRAPPVVAVACRSARDVAGPDARDLGAHAVVGPVAGVVPLRLAGNFAIPLDRGEIRRNSLPEPPAVVGGLRVPHPSRGARELRLEHDTRFRRAIRCGVQEVICSWASRSWCPPAPESP